MPTKLDRQSEFLSELKTLLEKYRVELQVAESFRSYCTIVDGISVFSFAKYDSDGNIIEEAIDTMIPAWTDGTNI